MHGECEFNIQLVVNRDWSFHWFKRFKLFYYIIEKINLNRLHGECECNIQLVVNRNWSFHRFFHRSHTCEPRLEFSSVLSFTTSEKQHNL